MLDTSNSKNNPKPGRISRGKWAVAGLLFLIGLVVRLQHGSFEGTNDMEWWKTWLLDTQRARSPTLVYGSSDRKIIRDWRKGATLGDLRKRYVNRHQRIGQVHPAVQPPGFMYGLYLAGKIHRRLEVSVPTQDPRSKYTRYYFCINLLNLIAALVIAAGIFAFMRRDPLLNMIALPSALVFWLNPLVYLNAPLQGYLDQWCFQFLLLSIGFFYLRKYEWGAFFFAVCVFTKPTPIIVAPVLGLFLLMETDWRRWIKCTTAAAAAVFLMYLPYLIRGTALSALLGAFSIKSVLEYDFSRQALNLPWLFQFSWNVAHGNSWMADLAVGPVNRKLGFPVDRVFNGLFWAYCVTNLWFFIKTLPGNRISLFWACIAQIYGYFVFHTAVHANHYFAMIPLLGLVALISRRSLLWAIACQSLFLIADFLFYGFGRDWVFHHYWIRIHPAIGWMTCVLALGHLFLAVRLLFAYPSFRRLFA